LMESACVTEVAINLSMSDVLMYVV
jgi:hypothetical protein